MLELSDLKQRETVDVEIKNPITGEGTGAFFTVTGLDSREYREAMREVMAKRIANDDIDYENDEFYILAKCTKSFKGFTLDGKEPEFNEVNVTRIYREYPFIKDQIDRFISNRRNFFLNA